MKEELLYNQPYKKMTIGSLLNRTAGRLPEREAIVFEDQRITYIQLLEKVNMLAKGLMALGVNKDDKVAVWMSNLPEFIYIQYALVKIGAQIVPANTRYKQHELEYMLQKSDVNTLIFVDELLGIDITQIVIDMIPELNEFPAGETKTDKFPLLKNVVCTSKEGKSYPGIFAFKDILDIGAKMDDEELVRQEHLVDPDDVAKIMFTSGTTGFPKGVMLTHHNIIYNNVWIGAKTIGLQDNEIFITYLPLFHGIALLMISIPCIALGGKMVLMEYFDTEKALELIEKEGVTSLWGVPATLVMLLESPKLKEYDTSKWKLRTGITGGAPVPESIMREVIEKMGCKGIMIGFGQTETSPVISMTSPDDSIELRCTTLGKPVEGAEIRIVDPVTGETVPLGKEGEIWARGQMIMKGYYKMPYSTHKTITKDGWLRMGDLAVMGEDGYLRFTGRLKDMYICGGFNAYPAEIENFLYKYPKIKMVQIFGVPDHRLGEVGAAWIELKEGVVTTSEEIIDFCKGKLANFKVPRYIKFVQNDDWPMTGSGKLKKFSIRELYMAELGLDEEMKIKYTEELT